jgi:hypothetical protein
MESLEDIQQQEGAHLLRGNRRAGRRLVELGWSREQVLVYVSQLLNESMDTSSGDPDAGKEEDGARGHDQRGTQWPRLFGVNGRAEKWMKWSEASRRTARIPAQGSERIDSALS